MRYFKQTNPEKFFFFNQADLEAKALTLELDTDFSSFHPDDPGKLVFDAVAHTGAKLRVERDVPFVPLPESQEAPAYPGHLIDRDSDDKEAVRLIQKRLSDLGFTQQGPTGPEPLAVDGEYGVQTADAVELFQIRHTDIHGRPLEVDRKVGSDTWGALFGRETIHSSSPESKDNLLAKVLEVALGEVGVREEPAGSNKGKRVQQYQRSVGIDPGEPWCAAFVFFCFATASQQLEVTNPMETEDCKTGLVVDLWNRARRANKVATISHDDALDDPSKVKPGMIFIISTESGHGHTGLVESVTGNRLETVEGNTNDDGSREGIGVFRRSGRTIDSINRGFINFGKSA